MVTTICSTPLPTLDASHIKLLNLDVIPNLSSTYEHVLQAERQATTQQEAMYARVVGWLLLEFHKHSQVLGNEACNKLIEWVSSSTGRREDNLTEHNVSMNVIYDLGTDLCDKFIRLFWTSGFVAGNESDSESDLEEAGEDHDDTLAYKDKVLARDGFRCMITGMLDASSVKSCPALADEKRHRHLVAIEIETTKILNESTMQEIDPQLEASRDNTYFSGALAILESLGFSDITEKLRKSDDIHQPWNLLSLDYNLHQKFNSLELWFEYTEQPNHYNICLLDKADEYYIHGLFQRPTPHVNGAPMVVEFVSQVDNVELPDPHLLSIHATCARVAHLSGATEFFEKLELDAEKLCWQEQALDLDSEDPGF